MQLRFEESLKRLTIRSTIYALNIILTVGYCDVNFGAALPFYLSLRLHGRHGKTWNISIRQPKCSSLRFLFAFRSVLEQALKCNSLRKIPRGMGCGRSLPDTSNTFVQDRPIQVHVMFGTKNWTTILIIARNKYLIILFNRVCREVKSFVVCMCVRDRIEIKIFTILHYIIRYTIQFVQG